MRFILTAAVTATLILAAPIAQAKPPLATVKPIADGLLAVGIADEIRSQCPSISARLLRAVNYLSALKKAARSMGYSDQEIKAYRSDPAEKAKMRTRGEAYLSKNGVAKGQPESYCALGRVEIQKSSQIGALLRAK